MPWSCSCPARGRAHAGGVPFPRNPNIQTLMFWAPKGLIVEVLGPVKAFISYNDISYRDMPYHVISFFYNDCVGVPLGPRHIPLIRCKTETSHCHLRLKR